MCILLCLGGILAQGTLDYTLEAIPYILVKFALYTMGAVIHICYLVSLPCLLVTNVSLCTM